MESLKFVTGVRWRHGDGDTKADGEAMETRPLTEQEAGVETIGAKAVPASGR